MDYTHFISERSKQRVVSPIRALNPLLGIPGMITLGAGNPNPTTFPYESFQLTLKNGEKLSIEGKLLEDALQYGPTAGLPALRSWLRELQIMEHNPPHKNFEISVGTGSQDLITKALEMFITPGDNVLVENPAYTGIVSFLRTLPFLCTHTLATILQTNFLIDLHTHFSPRLACLLLDVATDADGIVPLSLEHVLSTWHDLVSIPKILYTVPTGSNPTGVSAPLKRKREVYEIARRYNIIILEDDPYYYLQFTKPRTPSYLSFDVDARVLRFDSMSKILSAGMRLGWVTGPKQLIERIDFHTSVGAKIAVRRVVEYREEKHRVGRNILLTDQHRYMPTVLLYVSNLQPSSISQAIALALLTHWGHTGFFAHVDKVSRFYEEKRDVFLRCAERRLKGLAEWAVPTAGEYGESLWLCRDGE
ncbi:hypothetical protein BC936DRAFT_146781 [Jimgerdemannia flammicorona]|uniref:Aminotransferase class I/classII large domain-containing protein n=1 Tax=Jimgerdemannia flammicorona TaxID=994334 RepID=A0A433DLA1_9FUNG|nr:hypothetical protein BC936DRAFT_146781 [Jimgerdemannia flammicorona]